MKKILLATDGSQHANKLFDKVIDLAGKDRDTFKVDIIFVVTSSASKNDVLHYGDSDTANYMRKIKLQECVQVINDAGIQTRSIILHGEAAKTIIDYANNHEYDYVLTGNRGKSFLKTLLKDSISDKLIKNIQAPVMIIK